MGAAPLRKVANDDFCDLTAESSIVCDPVGDPTAESSNMCDPVGVPAESCSEPGTARPAESCSEPGTVRKSAESCSDPDTSCCVPGAWANVSGGEPAHLSSECDQPLKFSGEQPPPKSGASKLTGRMMDKTSKLARQRMDKTFDVGERPQISGPSPHTWRMKCQMVWHQTVE